MSDETLDGMPTFGGHDTFGDLVREVHHGLGGRVSIADMARAVRPRITDEQFAAVVEAGFRSRIRAELKQEADDGLPNALEVGGSYVEVPLFSVGEYREVIRKYLGRARANKAVAARLAEECQSVHGVTIAVDDSTEAAS